MRSLASPLEKRPGIGPATGCAANKACSKHLQAQLNLHSRMYLHSCQSFQVKLRDKRLAMWMVLTIPSSKRKKRCLNLSKPLFKWQEHSGAWLGPRTDCFFEGMRLILRVFTRGDTWVVHLWGASLRLCSGYWSFVSCLQVRLNAAKLLCLPPWKQHKIGCIDLCSPNLLRNN